MTEFFPIDYLLIGHLSEDRTPEGPALGGTVAYAGLTAHALGCGVGIVTSASEALDLAPIRELALSLKLAPVSTSFENRYTSKGRVQTLLGRASDLELADVPLAWRNPKIVHLAPLACEIPAELAQAFPSSFLGVTPQGSMREWDSAGRVRLRSWESVHDLLHAADAVVLSIEDLGMDITAAEAMATHCRVLVVTEAAQGARVYTQRRSESVPAPSRQEVDPTGAGDIFAAVYFIRLQQSGDPWEAAEIANQIAAASVARRGLAGTPTPAEAKAVLQATGN